MIDKCNCTCSYLSELSHSLPRARKKDDDVKYAIDLFVDGKRLAGDGDTEFTSVNPATGEAIGQFREASASQIELAIDSATAAQKEWAAFPAEERGRILRKAADLLRARNDELSRIEVDDTG
ncbi:MAG TPA: hypothetical protein DCG58_15905, partial [Hyphomonas adhaerens]|nr:hypothetical protein [Hyphomonas adhaerens]